MLSLVIPTYNERHNIAPFIQEVMLALEKTTESFEIIIVDDDSPDGTWQVAEELARANPHLRAERRRGERGLATAVVAGWRAATGELLGVMDGDFQHPPEALPKLLDTALHTGADIVVASRHIAEGGIREWSLARRLVSWGAALIVSVLLPRILRQVRDPMSGFFLLRRSVLEGVSVRPAGYKILLEVLAKGHYQTVAEVPYVFKNRRAGESKLGATQCVEFCLHLGRLTWETGQLRRFGRFCTVGMVGLFVNEAALIGFTEVGNLYHVASAVLAVELAIINNFLWNEWWTFHDRSSRYPGIRQRLRRFVHYNVICAIGAGLNVMTLWLLTDVTGLHYFISNLFGIGVATIWNYSLNANITWDLPVEYKVG
jgi:dolichol-phosphate mannosyltransferase